MRGTIGVKPGYEIDFQALWMVIQEIVLALPMPARQEKT
jgi:hypothetical protein